MHIPVSLNDIRNVIQKRKRVRFRYERRDWTSDFYILGQTHRTNAYVVQAWCVEPEAKWKLFRYAMIQDMEITGEMDGQRADYDPYHKQICLIDTLAFPRPPGQTL